jgi:hyperosmotically inducible protein
VLQVRDVQHWTVLEGSAMLRGLLRLIVLLAVVAAIGAYLLGYRVRSAGDSLRVERDGPAVGTVGTLDTDKARQSAARLGEKAAVTANEAAKALEDGALTAKIKAKMTLDDHVKAMDINVDTKDGIVTLMGRVKTKDEHDRAVRLASETEGVRGVHDQIEIR